jgi:heme/copper-type cytochrome/quinol oxidase subunit 2
MTIALKVILALILPIMRMPLPSNTVDEANRERTGEPMTNAQVLYLCVTAIVIFAVVFVTIIVKRNKDNDYNRGESPQRVAKISNVAMLMFPAFIVLGFCIIIYFVMFHFS